MTIFFQKDYLLNNNVTTLEPVAAPTFDCHFASSLRRFLYHFLVRMFFVDLDKALYIQSNPAIMDPR